MNSQERAYAENLIQTLKNQNNTLKVQNELLREIIVELRNIYGGMN